ncbi:MAG: type II secretion system secretin GspD [Thermodesulfovibrionia bacterium]
MIHQFRRSLCLIFIILLFLINASVAEDREVSVKRDSGITFNFIDVEMPALIKFVSEVTGYNFVFDEKVKGKVTIIAPTRLSIDESFNLFTSVLGLKGYTIIPSGNKTYKIVPSSLARQEGAIPTDGKAIVNEGYITKLIPLQYIDADEASKFLRPIVSNDGHISPFGPRNLLLIVDSAINIEKVISILEKIDTPSTRGEPPRIYVYFLENADAEDLAKVLDGILKAQARASTPPVTRKEPSTEQPIKQTSITPDKATNSLIIVATPSEYENIVQVIKELDKRRKQVFVEAMIMEASIEKLKEVGAKWRAMIRENGDPIVIGGVGTISTSAVESVITGLTGFSVGGMGNFTTIPISIINPDGTVKTQNLTAPGFAALFSLREFKDAVNVLSTPQILTSDNEEAEIIVGENIPLISKRERDITTTNTVLTSIERKDVGITLRITPQITEGDYVKLDLYQEISAVKETPESVLTTIGPTTTKRSTKTSVVVKDGQTVVIGGLMQEREEVITEKTPVLGDIPILNLFFRYKTTSRMKTNLLVFLTPHIVKESARLSEMTGQKYKAFADEERHYVEGELLVKFREGTSRDKAEEIIYKMGASIISHSEMDNTYLIKLKAKQSVEDAVREFTTITDVEYAEPNYKLKIQR